MMKLVKRQDTPFSTLHRHPGSKGDWNSGRVSKVSAGHLFLMQYLYWVGK